MFHSVLIAERLGDDGEPARTWLQLQPGAGAVVLNDAGDLTPLPARAVAIVMRRYGRELDPDVDGDADGERISVAELGTIERLRFRAAVDADGRDYLVWREPDRPPLAALSVQVAAALRFLAAGLEDGA